MKSKTSIDWLSGLQQDRKVLGAGVVDEGLAAWQAEAAGYKIRYVPTTLPDLLKDEATVRYEQHHFTTSGTERGLSMGRNRLDYQRRPETDMEVCNSVQCLRDFAAGAGVWGAFPAECRRAQLLHMATLADELYPTFRWFLI